MDPPAPDERPPALPSRPLAEIQTYWLRGARARLLRRAGIARRRRVVELGAGWGFAAEELARRSGGHVTAVESNAAVVAAACEAAQQSSAAKTSAAGVGRVEWIVADAHRLPLADSCCDIVFAQMAFLWFRDPPQVLAEVRRVLAPGGAFAAIEPDYGGMIEFPPEIAVQPLWLAAIARAGGDPCMGRKLPALLYEAGFHVEVQLPERIPVADEERFALLGELPLTPSERQRLEEAQAASRTVGPAALAHLPLMMIYAEPAPGPAAVQRVS